MISLRRGAGWALRAAPACASLKCNAAPNNSGLAAALRATPSLRHAALGAAPDNNRFERTKPNRGAQWAPRLIGFAAQPERSPQTDNNRSTSAR